jgi:hypothetical protein
VAFCLHNPSTADGEQDDPTSRRGFGFARAWGCSRLVYVNVWAGRATKPTDLWKMADPVGPDNDLHIAEVAAEMVVGGGFVVAAWGSIRPPNSLRAQAIARLRRVEEIIRSVGCDLRALEVNLNGSPRHPLYVRASAAPMVWP